MKKFKKDTLYTKNTNINFGKNTLVFLLIFSLLFNIFFFWNSYIINKNENKNIELDKSNLLKINKHFFPNKIKLKDYSQVKFKIKDEGKIIIENIRNFHKTPGLIDKAFIDKELCAGYIWVLSEKIWGKISPYHIGMMRQKTKKPAKAWELAYSYKYLGGDILIDFSDKINLKNFKTKFYDKISKEDLLNFFNYSFKEKSLFGDIGFLYKETKYRSGLLQQGVYNSHITKNLGLSEFKKQITFKKDLNNHHKILEKLFNSTSKNIDTYKEVISNYKFQLNGKNIFMYNGSFHYIINGNYIGKKVDFKIFDTLIYKDITIAHFFDSIGRVNGLLDFTLKGEFFPINIMTINQRFIEKM